MAAEAHLRFYEELNDYLPAEKGKREFAFRLDGGISIGQMLERLNVPVSEVEFVLVNGASADLSHLLADGDRVSVYPVFESFDVKPLLRFREKPLRKTRFIVASNLRPLAFYLRVLGFDASIGSCDPPAEEEKRIFLTTDPAALKYGLSRIYVVRETGPAKQLKEVLSRFDLCGLG